MLFHRHAAYINKSQFTFHGQHHFWLPVAMIRIASAIAICLGCVACASEDGLSESDLVVLEDYPSTLNLTTLPGTIERTGDCISITATDGSLFVPVFRPGNTLDQLEANLGSLDQAKTITVSNYNRMETLPDNVEAELERRSCSGIPIAFGSISAGEWKPDPPHGGAAEEGDAEDK